MCVRYRAVQSLPDTEGSGPLLFVSPSSVRRTFCDRTSVVVMVQRTNSSKPLSPTNKSFGSSTLPSLSVRRRPYLSSLPLPIVLVSITSRSTGSYFFPPHTRSLTITFSPGLYVESYDPNFLSFQDPESPYTPFMHLVVGESLCVGLVLPTPVDHVSYN